MSRILSFEKMKLPQLLLVSTTAWFASDLAGVESSPTRPNVVFIIADDSLSLRALLANAAGTWERPAFTIYEDRYFSARDTRYRYIQYPDGTEELYDHERDPQEFTNIANHPGSATIKQRFEKWKPASWAKSLGGRKG